MADKIKVLIVDDSSVVRQVLTAVLQQDPDVEVIGSVADPVFAMERMNRDWPDALVLDVDLPRADGIGFLTKLMSVRPTPVVVCSELTEKGAETTMEAMAAGAVAFITKPVGGMRDMHEDDASEIIRAVRAAVAGDLRRVRSAALTPAAPAPARALPARAVPARGVPDGAVPARAVPARAVPAHAVPAHAVPAHAVPAHSAPARMARAHPAQARVQAQAPARVPVQAGPLPQATRRLVAIGTSTGGTQALELVLSALPRVGPGIVVVQHMPEKFTAAFASRLDLLCAAQVLEAKDGDRVLPGRVLIAPGGRHMRIVRDGDHYVVQVSDGPRVNRHKPSVDVLFESVALHAGPHALGVIMTGMGDDGARGLVKMRAAGARTIGQDESTCVVYGMPAAAAALGAVERELPLDKITGAIQSFAARRPA